MCVLLNKICLFLKTLSFQNFEIHTTDISTLKLLFNFHYSSYIIYSALQQIHYLMAKASSPLSAI
jgi:hypothetical protein